jgi:hypothetical protein
VFSWSDDTADTLRAGCEQIDCEAIVVTVADLDFTDERHDV